MSDRKKQILLTIAGGFIGAAFYLLLIGPSTLHVQNVDWLLKDDPGAHYLAWSFFRMEPWTFPIGRLNYYGVELASNIVFADGIPLVAIPMKIISPLLPEDFQYFGWWALCCFVLQGVAAVWLLGKFTKRTEVLLIGAALFAIQPVMLFRFGQHFSLMGQWVIPLGFCLFLSPNIWRTVVGWGILLVVASLIHAYLLGMLLILFGIWSLREAALCLADRSHGRSMRFILQTMAVLLVLFAMMASVDYFRSMGLGSTGTKDFAANLLGWLLPTGADGLLLPAHKLAFPLQFEGFWYLGSGVLLLLACVLVAILLRLKSEPEAFWASHYYRPRIVWSSFYFSLAVFLAVSTAFSLNFGQLVVAQLPMPEILEKLMNVFRAIGRFTWPVATGLLFLALLGACRFPRWLATPLLLTALGLQFADVRLLGNTILIPRTKPTKVYSNLSDPRWAQLTSNHTGISVIPDFFWRFIGQEYDLALLAYKNRLKTDSAYYARYPSPMGLLPRWQRFHDFWSGRPDDQWIYIIHEDLLKRKNLDAWKSLIPVGHRLLLIDNYYVASFTPDRKQADSVVEWPDEALSPNWELLHNGVNSFTNLSGNFDRLFLAGFYPTPRGAKASYDLGVMAFSVPEGISSIGIKIIPQNPANSSSLKIYAELLSKGSLISERELILEPGWSDAELVFKLFESGNFILRLNISDLDKKSGQWRPRRGGGIILVDAVLFEAER